MAKSDLIHVQVEGNVFEGKADELESALQNYWKKVGKMKVLKAMLTYGNEV